MTSAREERLWVSALAVLVAIYATIGVVRPLAGLLREQGLLVPAFTAGLALTVAALLTQRLRAPVGRVEVGVWLGIAAVYLLVLVRIGAPEERTHLIEYSVLAALVYEALAERRRNRRSGPSAEALNGLADRRSPSMASPPEDSPPMASPLERSWLRFSAGPLTLLSVALLGWIDEALQSLVPGRFYDIRDVGFNALAGLLAVTACASLAWARSKWDRRRAS